VNFLDKESMKAGTSEELLIRLHIQVLLVWMETEKCLYWTALEERMDLSRVIIVMRFRAKESKTSHRGILKQGHSF